MKVDKCPKCGKSGFLTFRDTKYKTLKYPYIGHYEPSVKSQKKWCYLGMELAKNLVSSKPLDKKYEYLLKRWLGVWRVTSLKERKILPGPKAAYKILLKKGYSKKSAKNKLHNDLHTLLEKSSYMKYNDPYRKKLYKALIRKFQN